MDNDNAVANMGDSCFPYDRHHLPAYYSAPKQGMSLFTNTRNASVKVFLNKTIFSRILIDKQEEMVYNNIR